MNKSAILPALVRHQDAELKLAMCACGQKVELVYAPGTKNLVFKDHTEKITRGGNMRPIRCYRGSGKPPSQQ